jgi:DsbC/DsbD-like thiol-disulfide interchange protein
MRSFRLTSWGRACRKPLGLQMSFLRKTLNLGFEAFFALSAFTLFCFVSKAGAETQPHARIELIADLNSLQPSHILWAGLLFQLDPGWHVYWQNAGDSGEPPRVHWSLPPGFRAGAIVWPAPMRLGTGSVVDYGYENQVLLMVPIEGASVAAKSGKNGTIQLAADVSYLVCREICIPGKAHTSLSLPLAGDASSQTNQWQALFQQTKARLPKPLPAGWTVAARSSADRFTLSLHRGAQVTKAAFFPLEGGVIENSAPQDFAPSKAGFRLALKKSDLLTKSPARLNGVLVLDERRAYEISVPITSG